MKDFFYVNNLKIKYYRFQSFVNLTVNLSVSLMTQNFNFIPVFFHTVVYVFDAQTGKTMGDGKPITHKVHNHSVITTVRVKAYWLASVSTVQ